MDDWVSRYISKIKIEDIIPIRSIPISDVLYRFRDNANDYYVKGHLMMYDGRDALNNL